METQLNAILKQVGDKLLQIAFSVIGGLYVAFEASTLYWGLCFLIILIDVLSAYRLGRRLHRKYPTRCDGKFKSEYKDNIKRAIMNSIYPHSEAELINNYQSYKMGISSNEKHELEYIEYLNALKELDELISLCYE